MLDIATVLTTIFTYVDDYCKQTRRIQPGPIPELSDSEVITLALLCELLGKSSEHSHIRCAVQWLRGYFPRMIDRSRYHRRLKRLTVSINDVRKAVLPDIGAFLSLCAIDSTPVPVLSFQRACFTPLFPEGGYGYCAAKKLYYYGFKLHLVTTAEGIPVHFDLTPANISDVSMAEELLSVLDHATVLGDKGYVSESIAQKLLRERGIDLWTPKRKNQKHHEKQQFQSGIRQIVEVANEILKEHFHLEHTLAKTLSGLVRRVIRKLAAFTFGILINKLSGRELLRIGSMIN